VAQEANRPAPAKPPGNQNPGKGAVPKPTKNFDPLVDGPDHPGYPRPRPAAQTVQLTVDDNDDDDDVLSPDTTNLKYPGDGNVLASLKDVLKGHTTFAVELSLCSLQGAYERIQAEEYSGYIIELSKCIKMFVSLTGALSKGSVRLLCPVGNCTSVFASATERIVHLQRHVSRFFDESVLPSLESLYEERNAEMKRIEEQFRKTWPEIVKNNEYCNSTYEWKYRRTPFFTCGGECFFHTRSFTNMQKHLEKNRGHYIHTGANTADLDRVRLARQPTPSHGKDDNAKSVTIQASTAAPPKATTAQSQSRKRPERGFQVYLKDAFGTLRGMELWDTHEGAVAQDLVHYMKSQKFSNQDLRNLTLTVTDGRQKLGDGAFLPHEVTVIATGKMVSLNLFQAESKSTATFQWDTTMGATVAQFSYVLDDLFHMRGCAPVFALRNGSVADAQVPLEKLEADHVLHIFCDKQDYETVMNTLTTLINTRGESDEFTQRLLLLRAGIEPNPGPSTSNAPRSGGPENSNEDSGEPPDGSPPSAKNRLRRIAETLLKTALLLILLGLGLAELATMVLGIVPRLLFVTIYYFPCWSKVLVTSSLKGARRPSKAIIWIVNVTTICLSAWAIGHLGLPNESPAARMNTKPRFVSRFGAHPRTYIGKRHRVAIKTMVLILIIILMLLAIAGVHPNPGPPKATNEIHARIVGTAFKGSPPPPEALTRETGIGILDMLFGNHWRSCKLDWDVKKQAKIFRGQTPETDPFKRDREGAHYPNFYTKCDELFVVDLDEHTSLARDFMDTIGPNCNCIALTKKGAHYYFQGSIPELRGAQLEGVDVRTGDGTTGAGKNPDIVFAPPSSYGPRGTAEYFQYSWHVIPQDAVLMQCPGEAIELLLKAKHKKYVPHSSPTKSVAAHPPPQAIKWKVPQVPPLPPPPPSPGPPSNAVSSPLPKEKGGKATVVTDSDVVVIMKLTGVTPCPFTAQLPGTKGITVNPGCCSYEHSDGEYMRKHLSRFHKLPVVSIQREATKTTTPSSTPRPEAAQVAAEVVPPPAGEEDTATPEIPVGTGRPKARLVIPSPEVDDWAAYYESIRDRRAMRQVQFFQRHLWMDICEGICTPFETADEPTKDRIMWELFTAPKRFLYFPKEKVSARGMQRILLDRVQGNFDDVIEHTADDTSHQDERDYARAERFVKGGAFSRGARALDQRSLPPLPPEVQTRLAKDLHPTSTVPLPDCPDKGARYASLDQEHFGSIVRKLPRLAAPSGDGWTQELVFPLMSITACREVLTHILLGELNDTLPVDLARALRDSNFCLLTKDSSPEDPAGRPIAMPSLFTKIAALLSFGRVRGTVLGIFGDLQFGALRSQGTETVIIQSRRSFRSAKGKVLVTIDLRNAFNSIHRAIVLDAVHHYKLTDLFNLAHFLYGMPSRLLSQIIPELTSSNGVRQGDPLGPVLFSLGIHPTLTALTLAHPNVKVWAYIDDITILGTPEEVAAFISDLEGRFRSLGLFIRRDKSWVLAHDEEQLKPLRHLGLNESLVGIRVLGAWVAPEDRMESDWIKSRIPKMENFFNRLTKIDRQCGLLLFRWCGIPRWIHITRTHHPDASKAGSATVDELARTCITTMLGGDDSVKAYLFNNPLFTGSLTSIPFVELGPMAYGACVDGVDKIRNAKSQADRVQDYYKAVMTAWKNSSEAADARSKAHMACLTGSHSRAWVNCRPNRPEYKMRQCEVETAMRLRYLVPPFNDPSATCTCGHQCSPTDFIIHALDCKRVSGYTWSSRHALVKSVFKKVLSQYGFRPDKREPRFFLGGKGPDVIFQMGDAMVLVDLVICNPLADSYVEAEAATPGATLKRAEAEKDRRHSAESAARKMEFYPLALTTFGAPGKETLAFLRKISTYTANPTGFMRHMLSALDIAIQIGNARIAMAATARWWHHGVR